MTEEETNKGNVADLYQAVMLTIEDYILAHPDHHPWIVAELLSAIEIESKTLQGRERKPESVPMETWLYQKLYNQLDALLEIFVATHQEDVPAVISIVENVITSSFTTVRGIMEKIKRESN
jgi:hypothetical protein